MNATKLLPVLLLFAACNHKTEAPVCYLNQQTKATFNIKAGSYWIYQDSISGHIDSFVATRNHTGTEEGAANLAGQREYRSINIDQRYPGAAAADSARWLFSIIANLDNPDTALMSLQVQYGNRGSSDPLIAIWGPYPYKQTNPYGFVVNTYDSYALKGVSYRNVVRYYKIDPVTPSNYTVCFFNDSVGVIKMELSQEGGKFHKTWELARCYLIK